MFKIFCLQLSSFCETGEIYALWSFKDNNYISGWSLKVALTLVYWCDIFNEAFIAFFKLFETFYSPEIKPGIPHGNCMTSSLKIPLFI